MQVSRETRAFFLLTLVTMVWAGLMPTGKIALRSVPPLTIAAIRLIFGSLLLFFFLRRESRPVPWSPRLMMTLLLLGFVGYCGSVGCTYYGLRLTTVTNAALLNAASPVSLALLSVLLLKERLPPRAILGIILSVLGVAVIITRGSWEVVRQSQYNRGDLILLGTQLSWGAYTIYGRRLMERISPLAATTYTYMTGALWLIAGSCVLERDQWRFADVAWASWAAIAYQSTLGSFAHFWFYDAVAVIGPSRAGIFLNLVPVMAIGIAYFFLNEPITAPHVLGGVIVISGILVATRRSR
ncbi:MAG TPA: DMT family transporter [Methylomirabilota bacterium]|jgi:drug/metabolite transporter (DMT)-like permease|nr:DMT family transporter [Methylomirabilota bacterium]